jgi:hypothetical protein
LGAILDISAILNLRFFSCSVFFLILPQSNRIKKAINKKNQRNNNQNTSFVQDGRHENSISTSAIPKAKHKNATLIIYIFKNNFYHLK